MDRFQLVTIRPWGTRFGRSWAEALDSARYGLLSLGIDAPLNVNHIDAGATPILFGAHHLAPGDVSQLPDDAILYNFEQLLPGYYWFRPEYLALLRRFQVWDYAAPNVRWLHASGVAPDARYMPPGYVPQWTRMPAAAEDVDVLFYGLISPRRRALLAALQARGIVLKVLDGVFGEERDSWIARARIVLNLRLEDKGHFESLRVNYLMANRKAVVTEAPAPGDWHDDLLPGVRAVTYDDLVDACVSLLANHAARRALADEGFNRIKATPHHMSTLLSAAPEVARRKMAAT